MGNVSKCFKVSNLTALVAAKNKASTKSQLILNYPLINNHAIICSAVRFENQWINIEITVWLEEKKNKYNREQYMLALRCIQNKEFWAYSSPLRRPISPFCTHPQFHSTPIPFINYSDFFFFTNVVTLDYLWSNTKSAFAEKYPCDIIKKIKNKNMERILPGYGY